MINYVLFLTRNIAIDKLRRAHLESRYLRGVELDFAPGADAHIMREQTEILIDIIISNMPDQRQRIFKMSRYELLSTDEIAQQLGITRENVRSQLHLALKEIRRLLPVLSVLFFME